MLVLTPVAFVLGASLKARFASPLTGEMISVGAMVRWTRDGRGKSAMGIEFVEVPALVRRVIGDYIATLPALPAHA
jgi:hypothetical protein